MTQNQNMPHNDAERQLAWSRKYLRREKAVRSVKIAIVCLAALFLLGGVCYAALGKAGVLPSSSQSEVQSSSSGAIAAGASADETENLVPAPSSVPSSALPQDFSVTFDVRGGSKNYSPETVPSGARVAQPEQPVRSGYRFAGWYRNAECTQLWDFAADTVESDLTLYAKWADEAPSNAALPQTGIVTNGVFWCCTFVLSLLAAAAAAFLLKKTGRRS